MKIYVGNLSSEVTEQELRQEFEAFGEVTSVSIITDKYTGRPRGFGFVEMAKASEGQAAIAEKRLGIVRSLLTRLVRDPRIEVAGHITIGEVVALAEEDNEDTRRL